VPPVEVLARIFIRSATVLPSSCVDRAPSAPISSSPSLSPSSSRRAGPSPARGELTVPPSRSWIRACSATMCACPRGSAPPLWSCCWARSSSCDGSITPPERTIGAVRMALRVCRLAISHARRWCSSTTARAAARGVSVRSVAQPPWVGVARAVHGRVGAPRERKGKRAPSVPFIALCRLLMSLFRLCSLRCGQRRIPCRLHTFLSTVVQTPSVAAGQAEGGVGPGGRETEADSSGTVFDGKKRTCDVDDGPVKERRDLLNA
jgi:hypothetical protein